MITSLVPEPSIMQKYFNITSGPIMGFNSNSSSGQEFFNLPKRHPDYGKSVAAYYYWIFPNMMFDFYA
ncbi:hypothetical protein [Maribacter antarcticus]|uniref:hypothetical protein n=1 Tax=Maribacter antarcticus TaxID=505250 RepID=UPI0004798424|nr:hypothetical protein [Maribacter antarcticus]